eukprot:4562193-Pyramimonas_sp.AAC.1
MGEAHGHALLTFDAVNVCERGVAEADRGAGVQINEVALQHDGEVGRAMNVMDRLVGRLGFRDNVNMCAPGGRADRAGDVDS